MSILEFKAKAEPNVQGPAKCMQCSHEWVGVVTVDALHDEEGWLTCPGCSLRRGRFVNPFAPAIGTKMWQCGCKGMLFNITPDGIFCPNCGVYQVFPEVV